MQTGARFATLATLALATCFASVRLQPLDTDPAAHSGYQIQYTNSTSSSTVADANVTDALALSEATPGATDSIPIAIPNQPRCLSVAQWTGNALLATWSDSPAQENVTYYQLSCLVPTERHLLVAATFNASIIDNLDPGKTYVVALRACNAAGCSPNREKDIQLSRELDGVMKTPSAGDNQHCSPLPINQLLEMPMEVRCQPLSPTTVHLSWTDTGASLPIRLDASAYYTVRHAYATKHGPFETLSGPALRPSSIEESLTAAAVRNRNRNEINATSTAVVYGGLRPATSFEFAVSKVLLLQQNLASGTAPLSPAMSQSTRYKQSGWSMKIECRTLEAVPGNAPTGLVAKQYDVNAVEISWQPCTQPNGVVLNHTVLVCREPGCLSTSTDNALVWVARAVTLSDEFNGGRLVGIVEGLQTGTKYRFRVRDRNSVGESPPSDSSVIVYLDPNYTAIDEIDDDAVAQYDYSTVRNPDSEDRPSLNGDASSQGYTTPRSGDRQAELPRRFRTRRPSTTQSSSARDAAPQQEVWYAIVGAVSGAVTISVVIVVVIVCRRRRNAKMKRMLRECGTKQGQGDAEGCSRSHRHDHEPDACGCPRKHQRQVGAPAHAHPHSTLSVSLHGGLPSDASAALLYPSAQCMGKTPPTTPRGTLRRFTLSSTLGTPMSAASCVPLLNASNLPGSPFSTGQPDDVRFDSPKFGDMRYDPAGSQPSSPYRLGSTLTSASAAIGGANSCGSPGVIGAAVELRSLSSTADSNGSTGNADRDSASRDHRAARGVPFVSPLHLPRTIGLLNALGASTTERTADIPSLPPSQSLFGNAPSGSRMNDLSELRSPERERSRTQAFGAPDIDVCTTAGTGSNSTASLSSGGFAQRGTRTHTHALVDTTILSPLSKPIGLARGTISGGVSVHRAAEEQQRQTSTTRGGGALTPLSVSSSGSGSGSGSANNSASGCSANAAKTPTIGRSTLPPGCTRNTPPGGAASSLRHGGTMMLSPASGTTIDPGYASSTSMSLAPGGGAPSVDSGCISNPSRSTGTAHNRDDFQSYKSFSTDELSAETAHIEGIMKDLSSITQNDFC